MDFRDKTNVVDKSLLQQILEVSVVMARMRSVTPLLQYATDAAIKLVRAERGFVVLKRSDDDGLDFRVQQGERGDELTFGDVGDHVSNSVLEQVLETGKPLVIEDAMNSPHFGTQESVIMLRLRSIMCAPMVISGKVLGAIYVENRSERGHFDEDDLLPLTLFANQAAVAVRNARINDQLQHAYKVLRESDKIKSDFIAIAGHELRTPLTVIKGYTDILRKIIPDDERVATVVDGIVVGQQRLQEIVNNMLDAAKIEQGTIKISESCVRLHDVIEKIVSEFQSTLQERALTLKTLEIDRLPKVQGDFNLLSKVFDNLIVNAIKYTPDGRSIIVRGKKIRVDGKPWVEIAVQDTGLGIEPEDQELIFEKFYHPQDVNSHSSGETAFKARGPGLGLHIARGIVQAHQGRIWVESPGYDEKTYPGSIFYVVLPVCHS